MSTSALIHDILRLRALADLAWQRWWKSVTAAHGLPYNHLTGTPEYLLDKVDGVLIQDGETVAELTDEECQACSELIPIELFTLAMHEIAHA